MAKQQGKPLSDKTKRKISEAMRGRKLTEEHKRKIKLGMRRHFLEMPVEEHELEDSAA